MVKQMKAVQTAKITALRKQGPSALKERENRLEARISSLVSERDKAKQGSKKRKELDKRLGKARNERDKTTKVYNEKKRKKERKKSRKK